MTKKKKRNDKREEGFVKKTKIFFFGLFFIPTIVFAQNYGKIESQLFQLIEKCEKGIKEAKNFAIQTSVPLEEDKVVIILEIKKDRKEKLTPLKNKIKELGGEIIGEYKNLLKIKINLDKIKEIVDKFSEEINLIRFPYKPVPLAVTSEGVDLTNANIYHQDGYKGDGAKIAIIDPGFSGWGVAVSSGELPGDVSTHSFTDDGTMEGVGGTHGREVAEIVYDMAPEAEIYLVNFEDDASLGEAVDFCIEEGIDVINHSVGWYNSGPGDGTGIICEMTWDAYDSGILWANAAGNDAQRHWEGEFVDTDSDTWNEFASEKEYVTVNGSSFTLCLRWDDGWGDSDQDYDFYLYADTNCENMVACSTNRQDGFGYSNPTEEITLSTDTSKNYYFAIKKVSASVVHNLEVYSIDASLEESEHRVAQSSLLEPADSTATFAVGAISKYYWASGTLRDYSSQGPTNDGRKKPDICGPDGVSTSGGGFSGTSAASPHVAGAAGLILSLYPQETVSGLMQKLEDWAIETGDEGKDNLYGSGRLNLEQKWPQKITDLVAKKGFYPAEVELTWSAPGEDGTIGNISNGKYKIQYATYSISDTTPGTGIEWTTNTFSGQPEIKVISGLTSESTYYFRIWTQDGEDLWSDISNEATSIAQIEIISFVVEPSTYSFGDLYTGSISVGESSFSLLNEGNIGISYSLECSSSTGGWLPVSNTPSGNQFRLLANFNSSLPVTDDFSEADDYLIIEQRESSSFVFSGNQTGTDVPPGGERNLWFRMEVPAITNNTETQNILINLTVQE